VSRIRAGGIRRQQVRVGAPDAALTPGAGIAVISELCDRLGVIGALDAAVGPIKQRGSGVYGRKKRGVAYNHQGQRVGRPHVATWAETEIVLAADLGDGTDDPRATAPDLLRRALGCVPQRARAGRVALRADAGYFAGRLARVAHDEHISFAIGAKRIAPLWRLLADIAERRLARRDRHGQRPGRCRRVLPGLVACEHGAADPPGPSGSGSGLHRPAVPGAAVPCTQTSAPCRSPSWPAPRRSTATRSS
jgi:hypothetical protein